MRKITLFLFLFGLLCLTACGPIKGLQVKEYSFTVKPSVIPKHSSTSLILGVTEPTASPGYQTEGMVYLSTPYQHATFALHKWVSPPAQMLLPILVQALRAKGVFKAVITPPYATKANYRMDYQLLQLEQNFLNKKSYVVLTIQVNLFNNKTNRVVASKLFTTKVTAAQNTPYAGVVAANKAVAILATRIASYLSNKVV